MESGTDLTGIIIQETHHFYFFIGLFPGLTQDSLSRVSGTDYNHFPDGMDRVPGPNGL